MSFLYIYFFYKYKKKSYRYYMFFHNHLLKVTWLSYFFLVITYLNFLLDFDKLFFSLNFFFK